MKLGSRACIIKKSKVVRFWGFNMGLRASFNVAGSVLANYLEQNHCILNFKTIISKVHYKNATFVNASV